MKHSGTYPDARRTMRASPHELSGSGCPPIDRAQGVRSISKVAALSPIALLAMLLSALLAVQLASARSARADVPGDGAPGRFDARLTSIKNCLSKGKEAVLFSNAAVSCEDYTSGSYVLRKNHVEKSFETDYQSICRDADTKAEQDQRILPRNSIKEIMRRWKDEIDTTGIRIIGGVFCDDLDLSGIHIPFSLVLDESIFAKNVRLRNSRIDGDFSIENSTTIGAVYILRSDISGNFFFQHSYTANLSVRNSTIGGEAKLRQSLIDYKLLFDNNSINGDVDASRSYFVYGQFLVNRIHGVLDLGQTEAKCLYDIRKNELGDVVLTNFGFGSVHETEGEKDELYNYAGISDEITGKNLSDDPLKIYSSEKSRVKYSLQTNSKCVPTNLVAPGTFVFLDNHVRASMCFSSPRWLKTAAGLPATSMMYLNENVIDGQLWLNFTDQFLPRSTVPDEASRSSKHNIRIFNIKAETLIINFGFSDPLAEVKVNGLQFNRIYHSNARCEGSVSLRASKPPPEEIQSAYSQAKIPPDLQLPSTTQALNWITTNKFRATQPFASFVSAYENAGDLDGARELKIRQAEIEWRKMSLKVVCPIFRIAACDLLLQDSGSISARPSGDGITRQAGNTTGLVEWLEAFGVLVSQTILAWLADYGYRPERIARYVFGTIFAFWIIFHLFIKVVGFSVEGETGRSNPKTYQPMPKIYPIGFIFLFNHLLPAYKLREKDYKIHNYYMISRDEPGETFKYLGREIQVTKATSGKTRKTELWLDVLRFIGLIYLIFIIAALGKIVR